MSSHLDYELAGGSVIGRDHRVAYRNNQDAYYIDRFHECSLCIVTDGCSSGSRTDGSHNELGARLGARLLAKAIHRQVFYKQSDFNVDQALDDMLAQIRTLAAEMNDDFRHTVQENFLFTIVGALLLDECATFFAFGDGVVIVNGKPYDMGEHDNKPNYPAYRLFEPDQLEDFGSLDLRMKIVERFPLDALQDFLIGTDGVLDLKRAWAERLPGMESKVVGDLGQFWRDDRYFDGNPDLISRQLRLIARDWPKNHPVPGLLPDDTTLVVGRRRMS